MASAKYAKLNPPLEKDIQSAILEYLGYRNIFCWRNNTGAFKTEHGGFVRFGMPGSSDIVGILPNGRFLAIEVKRPGKLPTEEQAAFLAQIKRNGGVSFIATSVDDVHRELTHDLQPSQPHA